MPPTRRARNASTPADPGPIPADLEQSIVQGSLNEVIEKATSAAAQAAVSAFNGSPPPATVPPTQARDSSGNDALQISSPGERVPRALYFGLLHKYCHSFLSYRLLPN